MTNDWDEHDWSEAEMDAFAKSVASVLREPIPEDLEPDLEFVDRVMAAVDQYGPYIPYPTPHLREHPPVRTVRARKIWSTLSQQKMTIWNLALMAAVATIIVVTRQGAPKRPDVHDVAHVEHAPPPLVTPPSPRGVAVNVSPRVTSGVSTHVRSRVSSGVSAGVSAETPRPVPQPRDIERHDVTAPTPRDPLWGEVEATPAPPPEPASPLEGRVSPKVRRAVEQLVDSLRVNDVSSTLVVDRTLEAAAKGADDAQIIAEARQVANDLLAFHQALLRAMHQAVPHH